MSAVRLHHDRRFGTRAGVLLVTAALLGGVIAFTACSSAPEPAAYQDAGSASGVVESPAQGRVSAGIPPPAVPESTAPPGSTASPRPVADSARVDDAATGELTIDPPLNPPRMATGGVDALETAMPAASSAPAKEQRAFTTAIPPGQGDVSSEVAEVPVLTGVAVPMSSTMSFTDGVAVSISKITALTAEAIGPGEIAGAAVAVSVQVVNGATGPVSLDSCYVTLNDSTGSPGPPSTGHPADPFAGELPPGGRATGTYVFTVAESLRNPLTILVGYADAAEVVSFVGDVG